MSAFNELLQKWTTVEKDLDTDESIQELDDIVEKILEKLVLLETKVDHYIAVVEELSRRVMS